MGMRESIEVRVYLRSEESYARTITLSVPGGNQASRETARWTKPRRGERTGVSESIEARVHAFHQESHTHCVTRKRSRRESNPHLRFRKPLFCPLNYGNREIKKEYIDCIRMSKL